VRTSASTRAAPVATVEVAAPSALTCRREAIGQDLLELGQGAHRRLLDPGEGTGGDAAQADRDGDRLGVVQ
jgi:hypothetical protein